MPNEEDTLAHPEQPRILLSAWLWAVMLFVFFGVIVLIAFGAMSRGSTYEEDRAKTRMEKLKAAREGWDKEANSYGWVNKDKGIAHIPVQRAMELELVDLQARKPSPAGPISTPAPAEVPATTSGAPQPTKPPNVAPNAPPGASAIPAASAKPAPSKE
ncbi:MAG: hypothetical protein ACREIF_09820 [Chthoniobacterales bacterium]